jgi:hypothetical protein
MRALALASVSVLLAGCAHAPLRFRDAPADYAALGLTDTVVPREDGRRSRADTDDYEWWYLDGVAKDGTVVVVVFGDNWLPGTHTRAVTLDVTPPGQPTRHASFVTAEPGAFSVEHADVRIGQSHFEGDLTRYHVTVDAQALGGLGCDLELTRRVASYRPGTGVLESGPDFFAWVVPVPEGALSGTLTLDGHPTPFEGSGYHDHNWGNVPPWALLKNWWWGRGEVAGHTVVMAQMRPAAGRGDQPMTLLFAANPEGVVIDTHGPAVTLAEGPQGTTADPRHDEPRAGGVTLESAAGHARFTRHGAPITSLDLLGSRDGVTRFVAHLAGKAPWYTRWKATVDLDAHDAKAEGTGTLEYMNFE